MKKVIYSLALFGILAIGLPGCMHKVSRVDVNEQIDISGKWNDVDSRLTAENLVEQILGEVWLSDFVKSENQKPVVIVGFVKNKSHEHIEAETFIKDVEKSFIKSQRVRLVQGGAKRDELRAEKADQQNNASVSTMKKWGLEVGADFIMQGSINSIVDAYKRDKVVYYQVDLELTNIETNEVVWIGDKKIKKTVRN